MAGALVTRAEGSAKRGEQPGYSHWRKRGDNLGFCRTKTALITRTPQRATTAFMLICVSFFNLVELQQGRWSSTIPPWSQRCVKPHILSVRLSHAPALCLVVPELHFPQLRLRTVPRSRTPRASDLPSALSKRPEMIGITIGANKASTGFPLQKQPAEDGSCSLIDVPSPSIYGLTLSHPSCCKCPRDTW